VSAISDDRDDHAEYRITATIWIASVALLVIVVSAVAYVTSDYYRSRAEAGYEWVPTTTIDGHWERK